MKEDKADKRSLLRSFKGKCDKICVKLKFLRKENDGTDGTPGSFTEGTE